MYLIQYYSPVITVMTVNSFEGVRFLVKYDLLITVNTIFDCCSDI